MIETRMMRIEALEQEATAFLVRGSALLGLDFDGTLVPFAPRPDAVELDADGRGLLEALRDLPGVHVAIVSGRRLDDLIARVAVDGIAYVGNHGTEGRHADGREWDHCGPREVAIARLARNALVRFLSDLDGVWVEDKGSVIGVHYRQAAWRARDELTSRLASWRRARPPGLRERWGNEVTEFFADSLPTKGDALFEVARDAGVPDAEGILYVGDDETDEEAFRRLGPGALTVRVGEGTEGTLARHRLPGVAGVRRLLETLRSHAEEGRE